MRQLYKRKPRFSVKISKKLQRDTFLTIETLLHYHCLSNKQLKNMADPFFVIGFYDKTISIHDKNNSENIIKL